MENISSFEQRLPRFLLSPWIYHGFRIFIGALFLYTGVTKLFDVAGFSESIAAYGILPAILLPCAAVGLPAAEVAAGFGTLLNKRWGLLGILAMMILFTGVLGYGVAVGLEIDCGCFSNDKETVVQKSEPESILDIPEEEGSLFGENILVIEPVAEDEQEETCSEGEEAVTKTLWPEFIRDIFLLLGVVYLVAWGDMRKKWSIDKNPEFKGQGSED
jgi:uncharacterized membrane protein YphA (DoxX/SURF4 family)